MQTPADAVATAAAPIAGGCVVDGQLVEATDQDVLRPGMDALEDLMAKKKTIIAGQPDAAAPAPVAGGSTVDGVLVEQTDTHVTGPTYEGQPAPPPVDGPIPDVEAEA